MPPNVSSGQSFTPSTTVEEDTGAFNNDSELYGGSQFDGQPREPTPVAVANRTILTQVDCARLANDRPPHARRRVVKQKAGISVTRLKGCDIRGITAADTTRTILEQTIDDRLATMVDKMQTLPDSSRQNEIRSEINLISSFKQSLGEKLLDLQDANDVLTDNLKKRRIFKRGNAELRRDILALQNDRQEIALEQDDVQADFESRKVRLDFKMNLSANMSDIEAAIQNGRMRAEQQGREDEGPDISMSMLLETVSRDVGSNGGVSLAKVKSFNSRMQNAANWLESGV
ncbi:hypothetical protein E8E12_002045 [Didymella heteroderae]|uniref:Inner kinetochore subunit AME1 domain-containing protein n=1 Tax=Didymella heteroderae TaxID=1769908 RepID=A0A9P4WGU1_9PLEO|nr:hypothetical protein E8E12_002045 [Didymella heteroderae]